MGSYGWLSGSGRVGRDGKFRLYHTLKSDLKTEGNESLTINVYSDPIKNNLVASSAAITIQDTSIKPKSLEVFLEYVGMEESEFNEIINEMIFLDDLPQGVNAQNLGPFSVRKQDPPL